MKQEFRVRKEKLLQEDMGKVAKVIQKLSHQNTVEVGGLTPEAHAWWLQQLAESASTQHLWIVTDSFSRAQQLRKDLTFFSHTAGNHRNSREVFAFPHWDTMPFEFFSPSQEVMAQRLTAIDTIQQGTTTLGVTSVQGWMQATLPKKVITDSAFTLSINQQVERKWLLEKLINSGYTRVELVEAVGEFSVRGHLVDVFSPQQKHPLRLDFFDDEIKTMRLFNAASQVSLTEVAEQRILPAREAYLNPTSAKLAMMYLRQHKAQINPQWYQQLWSQLEDGSPFAGCEQLISLYHGKSEWLHQYLPLQSLVVLEEPESVWRSAQAFEADFMREAEHAQQKGLMLFSPETMFLSTSQLKKSWESHKTVLVRALMSSHKQTESINVLTADNNSLRLHAMETPTRGTDKKSSLHVDTTKLAKLMDKWQSEGSRILLATYSGVAAERFQKNLKACGLSAKLCQANEESVLSAWRNPYKSPSQGKSWEILLLNKTPSKGFRLLDENGNTRFCLITESEWLGETRPLRPKPQSGNNNRNFATTIAELQSGQLVVHVDYGIGRYQGLKKLTVENIDSECLEINYATGGKIYVPVSRLHLVQKYVGSAGEDPPLNKLGDGRWQRTCSLARKVVQDMARRLVDVQAARQAHTGPMFLPSSSLLDEFSQGFQFQETPDQQKAIEEVLKDLAQRQPMDRLVCGEVGFGKTEVAMRAAFAVTIENGQVMLLCPTTVLAQQHYTNFHQRFHHLGIRVEILSRFVQPKQQKKTLREFQNSEIDILIGTHRLLSKDVKIPENLGLLVIDEEQRFGVIHKERIKTLRTNINILTLSATPIPRTLHMSMMGIRDLSLISTPPHNRLSVRTRIARYSEHIIRECIEREIRRDGQAFFLHNRVESIYSQARYIKNLLPDIYMEIAHGQMPESKLETTMQEFVAGRIQLLVCTAIIESGLDIPRANTIIINQAENFGLAQLHQLRGRVGRSHKQGYAWLLTHPTKPLQIQARKRLNLLQEFSALGAGFRIATHDLEIRGAGNLLGAEQTGHMHKVGLELFTKMVTETVAILKGKTTTTRCRLELPFSYLLPETYVIGTRQRLEIYKRLAEISHLEELWQLRQEMEDRFGMPIEETNNLFTMVQVRLCAESYGIGYLKADQHILKARFRQPERINMQALMALIKDHDNPLQLQPENWLILGPMPVTPVVLLDELETLSNFIQPQVA